MMKLFNKTDTDDYFLRKDDVVSLHIVAVDAHVLILILFTFAEITHGLSSSISRGLLYQPGI